MNTLTKIWLIACLLFTITQAHSQVVTSVIPTSGVPGQTLDVMVRGENTHFVQGQSHVSFGTGVNVLGFNVINPTLGTASIQVLGGAVSGKRDVQVITSNEIATFPNGFEVFPASGVLRATLEVLPVQGLSLSDLDPSNPINGPSVFFVKLFNDNVARTVTVEISVTAGTRGYLGRTYTEKRSISANAYVGFAQRDFTKFENSPEGVRFYQQVLSSGTFPPDNYTYQLKVYDENGNVIAQDVNESVIANVKSNPELILPGDNFNQPLQEIYTPLPLFQWFGQLDTYDFALYFIYPGQTAEEATRNLPVFKTSDLRATNLLYPNYAEKLIDGKDYAWQIIGKTSSAKGVAALPSQVFRFRYKTAFSGGTAQGNVARIAIFPQEVTLTPGKQVQFTASFFDANNNSVSGLTPQWQLSSPDKGTITADGLFTAGAQGCTIAVVVNTGGANDFATVTIKPVGTGTIINTNEWLIEQMLRQMFGLPSK
jgi:hypothetical protein